MEDPVPALVSWLQTRFNGAVDHFVGKLAEQLGVRVDQNGVEAMKKVWSIAKKELSKRKFNGPLRTPSRAETFVVLHGIQLVESEDLQRAWGFLLANFMDERTDVDSLSRYGRILSQLDSREAIVLSDLAALTAWAKEDLASPRDMLHFGDLGARNIVESLSYLAGLGLVDVQHGVGWGHDYEDMLGEHPTACVEINDVRYHLTVLGYRFAKACSPSE